MANPAAFVDHLRAEGYHPRSDKHSNALARAIVRDLVTHCRSMRDAAARGELVFQLNVTLHAGTSEWKSDLVLGPPALGQAVPPSAGASIVQARPSRIDIAVELKSVMTEHRKAVKNRKRDLEAHHEHVHHYNRESIAGGVLVINAASTFLSPLRTTPTTHREPEELVRHCIAELRAVALRGGSRTDGLDAKCAIVVSMDNVHPETVRFVTRGPAPPVGDPLHYDAFIHTICDQYTRQFAQRE